MDNNLPVLMDAICQGWTKSLPEPYGDGAYSSKVDGFTDCNRFVNFVAEKLGYKKFVRLGQHDPILANSMFRYMVSETAEWPEIDAVAAQAFANQGCLVIAAQEKLGGHGHVCIVRPGTLGSSGKWNTTEVPKVANVSAPNLCRIDRGANFAFSTPPRYFVLKKFNP